MHEQSLEDIEQKITETEQNNQVSGQERYQLVKDISEDLIIAVAAFYLAIVAGRPGMDLLVADA